MPRRWRERSSAGQALSEYLLATAVVVIVAASWYVLMTDVAAVWQQAVLRAVQSS